MKVYLAHATDSRREVRAEELRIEKLTGIELFNPFYDCDRPDIHEIDAGLKGKWECDATEIVERDLKHIKQCDMFMAVIDKASGAGTHMEIAYAHMFGKTVIVLDLDGAGKHLWLRYHANFIVKTWDAAIQLMQNEERVQKALRKLSFTAVIAGHNGTDINEAIRSDLHGEEGHH